jgi:orotidine-5'-phosphate decarboxylase
MMARESKTGARKALGVTVTAFRDLLLKAQKTNNSLLCVGLDPNVALFPDSIRKSGDAHSVTAFNRAIIEATSDIACCYKPNLGFYLPLGQPGIDALIDLRRAVPANIPLLLDAKVGDIDTTTAAYARAYFDAWGFDAVTANPYMGRDSLAPLMEYANHGVFLLAKTSNPGSGFLQDRVVEGTGERVSHVVARTAIEWNSHNNLGLVVGATYPEELRQIRDIAADLPILVPGIGAQSGELEASVAAGVDQHGAGLLINASRAISYASTGSDFQDAARAAAIGLRDRINAARKLS